MMKARFLPAEWSGSVKNHTDVLIFHTAICAGASQIAIMADEKSPSRISRRLPSRKRSGMEM